MDLKFNIKKFCCLLHLNILFTFLHIKNMLTWCKMNVVDSIARGENVIIMKNFVEREITLSLLLSIKMWKN